jgi:predicted MPP superfamily phosphohydrolase
MLAAVAVGVLGLLVWQDFREAWFVGSERRILIKLSIYWGLWLLWPAMIGLAWLAWQQWLGRRRFRSVLAAAALGVCVCLTWGRFIEPHLLQVHETTLGSTCGVRVALISDLHLGLYTRQDVLERLVDRLNTLNVDAVLVAGDWTYEPSHDLQTAFAPLAKLRHPVLSVLGNHDEQHPGPPLKTDLLAALAAAKVQSIDGMRVPLGRCELEGLGDLTARSAPRHLQALESQPSAADASHRIVLTHNPDTVFLLPPGHATWLLAGHTHGGQIDLPLLTRRLLARVTEGGFRQGVYTMKNANVFVTSGIGIDKFPFRFRVPPTIDVLTL